MVVLVRGGIETIDGSYCADFGVDMDQGRAVLIELSPFRNCTGPALFARRGLAELVAPERADVQDDLLKNKIQDDDGTMAMDDVFRVRSEPIPGIGGLVEMS